jgi:alpha-glucosidase
VVSRQSGQPDYFSHKPVRDIDFDKPAARAWFFNDALKHSFDTGIVGWWNDEADDTGSNTSSSTCSARCTTASARIRPARVVDQPQLLARRATLRLRLWSGDIATGFASMAGQRARMLSAIDVGAMQWGMDGGGFLGIR